MLSIPKSNKKGAGRPAGRIQDRPFQIRLTEDFLRSIDEWRRGEPDIPSRSEAIRRLVELGFTVKRSRGA
jgi:hypothetical protein